MMPAFLLPEKTACNDGWGAHVLLDQPHTRLLQLTLGITRIREHETLQVHVCGSADGEKWRPLAAFPRKSFCGTYQLNLDLSRHSDVRYLRTEWKMHRWTQDETKPVFSFYVWAESLHPKALRAAS
jgi:hypothetical protein